MILLGEVTLQQANCIKQCLDVFCSHSGQKVNFHKSFLQEHPAGHSTSRLRKTRYPHNRRLRKVPRCRLKKETFVGLITKIQSKLARWKMKTLSLAGRRTLAPFALFAIPSDIMQTTPYQQGLYRISRT